jgi:hypothetical protein
VELKPHHEVHTTAIIAGLNRTRVELKRVTPPNDGDQTIGGLIEPEWN